MKISVSCFFIPLGMNRSVEMGYLPAKQSNISLREVRTGYAYAA
jgi:hypothetical protein